jgi:hypothetical protein
MTDKPAVIAAGATSLAAKDEIRVGFVVPEDFGAVGDGVTDDGPALLRLFAYAESRGGASVHIPAGRVYATSTAFLVPSNTYVWGGGTIKCLADGPGGRGFIVGILQVRNVIWDGPTVDGNGTLNANCVALGSQSAANPWTEDIFVNATVKNARIDPALESSSKLLYSGGGKGYSIQGKTRNVTAIIRAENCDVGATIEAGVNGRQTENLVLDLSAINCQRTALYIQGSPPAGFGSLVSAAAGHGTQPGCMVRLSVQDGQTAKIVDVNTGVELPNHQLAGVVTSQYATGVDLTMTASVAAEATLIRGKMFASTVRIDAYMDELQDVWDARDIPGTGNTGVNCLDNVLEARVHATKHYGLVVRNPAGGSVTAPPLRRSQIDVTMWCQDGVGGITDAPGFGPSVEYRFRDMASNPIRDVVGMSSESDQPDWDWKGAADYVGAGITTRHESVGAPRRVAVSSAASINSPFGSSHITPIFDNRLSYADLRGATVTVTRGGEPFIDAFNLADMFRPDNRFATFSGMGDGDPVVIEVDFLAVPINVLGATAVGIEGRSNQSFQDVKLELWDPLERGWLLVGECTDNRTGSFAADLAPVNRVTKLRVTASRPVSGTAGYISQLFLVSSVTAPVPQGFLPRGGGNLYGTEAQPPALTASGGDVNIDLRLAAKGSGHVTANGVPVVSTTGVQSITNKTLVSPTITGTPIAPFAGAVSVNSYEVLGTPGKPVISTMASVGTTSSVSIIPSLHNALSYLQARGGSVTMTRNGEPFNFSAGSGANMFTPFVRWSLMTGLAASDVVVIEVDFTPLADPLVTHTVFGVDFRGGAAAKDVSVESWNGTAWTNAGSVTNNPANVFATAAVSSSTLKKVRFTLTNFVVTSCRISSLFSVTAQGEGVGAVLLPRSGGDLYGTETQPPALTASGGDANIDLRLAAKGSGQVTAGGNPVSTKVNVPASATAAGRPGQWAEDNNHLFIYTGDGTAHAWRRAALQTW